jgi:integrase
MGMTYKRGNIWWIKYYRNGKPYRESTRSHKEADAKRLLKKREGEISEGKLPGVYFDKVRFEELAGDFINDYRINGKGTLNKAERTVRLHLGPFFEGMRAPNVTTTLVREYIAQRQEAGAANATINRELAALKRMFNLGSQCTPPKVAQVPYIPMLKENNTRKGFFEHEEFLALRSHLPNHLQGMVTFGYKTGWRVSEITGLTWDQVDTAQGIVRLEVGDTKNQEARTVYLDDELQTILKAQKADRHLGCPHVFHRDGHQIIDFRGSWSKACQEAKLKGKLFHDLRRTAVRNMVRAGIPERVAMMISGHKTRSVFDRYNIVSADDLKQAAAKLEAYLPPSTGTVAGTTTPLATKKEASPVRLTS